ncbi:pyridoxamine 5'-phosphate oxidase family protein [Tepidiforma flava]|uniref:Pyridoxamine 5'-phosphate oxidase family protein n=1 Tax=Tepidiforma flava TaxID=3004094 RepID=A0ABY7M4R0_9CHLR|nr:pyridoxamine 5'-phosphate oxidase family protein [Tepidiforma flava]WBL34766.1 pyridoxamine 5'-phosphate oxidase family protein [Tepidiforma flava]
MSADPGTGAARPAWWSRQYIEPFTLDDDELWRIVRESTRAAVAWVTKSGEPVVAQMSYCWYDGHIWLTSTPNRDKYRALKRNPAISLSIHDPADWFKQVTIRGRVAFFHDRESVRRFIRELITAGGRRAVAPEVYEREFARFDSPERAVLRVDIERIRSYDGRKMWQTEAEGLDPWSEASP